MMSDPLNSGPSYQVRVIFVPSELGMSFWKFIGVSGVVMIGPPLPGSEYGEVPWIFVAETMT